MIDSTIEAAEPSSGAPGAPETEPRRALATERPPPATAGAIATAVPAVDLVRTNDEVMAFFAAHHGLEAVAVLEEGAPVGLINRKSFFEAYVRPFARELFGRRSCGEWMERAPLIVDEAMPVEQLVRSAVAAGAAVLKDGFITTHRGGYAGLGAGFSLMEAMSALEAERTRKLLESIDYASMIQRSHLRASDDQLAAGLSDFALVWEPRDVVGGDCYFFRRFGAGLFGAVLDCTGHGVPGAFMTLIALSFLDHAVTAERRDPGATLAGLNRYIKRVLGQRAGEGGRAGAPRSDDGLDGACFWIDADGEAIELAGAHLPVLVARPDGGPAESVPGARASVGYLDTPDDQEWPTRRVPLESGSLVAIATDGLYDQVGGFRGIALGRRRFAELVGAHRAGSARDVARRLLDALAAWQGDEPRRDDLTLLLLRARPA